MRIENIFLYHISITQDIPQIEETIRREDEQAYREHGLYFRNHRGSAFLVHEGDVGYDVRALLTERYDPQGLLSITGSEAEMQELTCLLDSVDVESCLLCGKRLLLLPRSAALVALVLWLKERAITNQASDQGPPKETEPCNAS